MVALLSVVALVATSNAESDPAAAAGPPTMQAPAPDGPGGSGAFMGRRHHGNMLEAMQKKLGITDDQKKQIRALYVGYRDKTRKARIELMSLKDEKKTMLLSGKIDQQKLAQIDDQVVKLVGDIMKEKLKLRRDRLALLTPEQIGRLADWQAERAFQHKWKRMHGGRGFGGFHHGPGFAG
jgi:Spy/CpxP family protein refolding chaperone